MRGSTAFLITLAIAGCGKQAPKQQEPAARTVSEPLAACVRGQLQLWQEIAERGAERLPRMDIEALACADLYGQKECRAAWSALFSVPDAPEHLARVGDICSKAYCERLPAPRPRLCAGEGAELEHNELVDALIELDTAILSAETGWPEIAAKLAQKTRLFRVVEVPVTPVELPRAQASPDVTATLAAVVASDGSVLLNGEVISDDELRRACREHAAANPDTGFVISAAKEVEYRRVVEILDIAVQSGLHRVSFAPYDTAAPAPPSPAKPR